MARLATKWVCAFLMLSVCTQIVFLSVRALEATSNDLETFPRLVTLWEVKKCSTVNMLRLSLGVSRGLQKERAGRKSFVRRSFHKMLS